jgi:diguanylate cyclase (GGDEF)-like protein
MAGVVFLGIVAWWIAPERSATVFQLLPIALLGWYGAGRQVYFLALGAAAVDTVAVNLGVGPWTRFDVIWNGAATLVVFLAVGSLVRYLREAIETQWMLALTDPLTGLANAPAFFGRLQEEIGRSLRYGRVFTLAYFDLDNFKEVNDNFGHTEGDEVLRQIAERMQRSLRGSDLPARLGGDEFGVLLPETPYAQAEQALEKLRTELVLAMRDRGWQVTLSIGAVTFESPVDSADAATRIADGLMYTAKREGGDRIRHLLWAGDDGGSVEPDAEPFEATPEASWREPSGS